MKQNDKKSNSMAAGLVDKSNLPRHIAIIMDGNGRWAQKRGLPRAMGHRAGSETFRAIATACSELGIGHLTVYAFSTENWKRPPEEVNAILKLLEGYLGEAIEKMEEENLRVRFFGDLSRFPQKLRDLAERTMEISKRTDGMQVGICLNYGGRDELVRAARACAADCVSGKREAGSLTEQDFSAYLDSRDMPDPDLVIRTGGETRLSNFLLWQAAYAELYFTDVFWPDFSREDLLRAIAAYQGRTRRFGGV